MVKDNAIGAGGLRFDSCTGQIKNSVAAAATFHRSWIVQVQSRQDGLRHSV